MDDTAYTKFHLAVTATAFPLGLCDALYFAKTITTSGAIGVAADDTTIDLGLVPIGTTIRGAFKSVTFAGGPTGAIVACYRSRPLP